MCSLTRYIFLDKPHKRRLYTLIISIPPKYDIHGLVQDCNNSITNALALLQFYI